MNSINSKTTDLRSLLLNLIASIRNDKYEVLSSLSICYTCKNIEKSYKYNKFKISSNME